MTATEDRAAVERVAALAQRLEDSGRVWFTSERVVAEIRAAVDGSGA